MEKEYRLDLRKGMKGDIIFNDGDKIDDVIIEEVLHDSIIIKDKDKTRQFINRNSIKRFIIKE